MLSGLVRNSQAVLRALLTRTVEFEIDRIPHRFERVPLRKILNWIRLEASVRARPERPWGLPTILQIESTNRCNLRCALCPVTEGTGRESGAMEPERFRRIIDQARDHVFVILLWEWGEPFVHPGIYEMIAYAKQNGIQLLTSSNGHLFARGDNAEKVVRSGLDNLIIALDGLTQETYTRYRQDGDLEAVLAGIRAIVAKKKELNVQTPRINLRFIVMKHNEHEIPDLGGLAESLGVDELTLKTLFPGHDIDPATDRDNEFIPENPDFRRFKYTDDFSRIRRTHNPCPNLWRAAAIHWNGAVCPCSFDKAEEYTLGNVNQAPLKEIWLGEPYIAMRRKFRTDWESIPVCSHCSYAYEGGDCSRETIVKASVLQS